MQNKPNFRKCKMNINPALVRDYGNIPPTKKCQNKPNQTQFQLKNEANKPNRTQFQPKNAANKPNQTQFYPPPADSKAKKMLIHLTINIRPGMTPRGVILIRQTSKHGRGTVSSYCSENGRDEYGQGDCASA